MATSRSLPACSAALISKPETLTDFVLFGEDNDSIYYDSRQTSFMHQSNPPFHQQPIHSDGFVALSTSRVEVIDSWSAMLENQGTMDSLQSRQHDSISKPFYAMDMSTVASASSFNGYPAAYSYVTDITSPVTFTDDSSMPPAPGVILHPPTFPLIPQGDYRRSAFPSPVTSAGGWDGHSSVASGISGSEAGSNSPYLNDDHSLFNPAYATGMNLAQLPIPPP